jgi:hypothetical protein
MQKSTDLLSKRIDSRQDSRALYLSVVALAGSALRLIASEIIAQFTNCQRRSTNKNAQKGLIMDQIRPLNTTWLEAGQGAE